VDYGLADVDPRHFEVRSDVKKLQTDCRSRIKTMLPFIFISKCLYTERCQTVLQIINGIQQYARPKNCNKLWRKSTTNPVPVLRIAASRGFSELANNVTRSCHGHSTPSLKISCKSVQLFSRNLANKETKI